MNPGYFLIFLCTFLLGAEGQRRQKMSRQEACEVLCPKPIIDPYPRPPTPGNPDDDDFGGVGPIPRPHPPTDEDLMGPRPVDESGAFGRRGSRGPGGPRGGPFGGRRGGPFGGPRPRPPTPDDEYEGLMGPRPVDESGAFRRGGPRGPRGPRGGPFGGRRGPHGGIIKRGRDVDPEIDEPWGRPGGPIIEPDDLGGPGPIDEPWGRPQPIPEPWGPDNPGGRRRGPGGRGSSPRNPFEGRGRGGRQG